MHKIILGNVITAALISTIFSTEASARITKIQCSPVLKAAALKNSRKQDIHAFTTKRGRLMNLNSDVVKIPRTIKILVEPKSTLASEDVIIIKALNHELFAKQGTVNEILRSNKSKNANVVVRRSAYFNPHTCKKRLKAGILAPIFRGYERQITHTISFADYVRFHENLKVEDVSTKKLKQFHVKYKKYLKLVEGETFEDSRLCVNTSTNNGKEKQGQNYRLNNDSSGNESQKVAKRNTGFTKNVAFASPNRNPAAFVVHKRYERDPNSPSCFQALLTKIEDISIITIQGISGANRIVWSKKK